MGTTAPRRSTNAELQELSLDLIVRTTVELLDEGGLDALTMRSLGARLGRSTMATYRHVGSRERLLQLAAAAAQTPPPDPIHSPWDQRLEALIRHGWETTFSVHPWVAQLHQRGIITPTASPSLEPISRAYADAGFDDEQIGLALVAHWSFMVGTLTVVDRLRSSREDVAPATEDAVFEFNLATYLAGIRAMADEVTSTTGS